MISAQTLRVCREGKPVSTFSDHALSDPENYAGNGHSIIDRVLVAAS
jgi:hypothetical protein